MIDRPVSSIFGPGWISDHHRASTALQWFSLRLRAFVNMADEHRETTTLSPENQRLSWLVPIITSAILECWASSVGLKPLTYLTKPLTMLLIIGFAVLGCNVRYGEVVVCGLCFSLAGDVALMLSDNLMLGLVPFLCAHVCYTRAFLRWGDKRPGHPTLVIAVVYGSSLIGHLWPRLGTLRFPVVVYTAAILTMAVTAVTCLNSSNASNRHWFAAIGALLFVVSDSLLATHTFGSPFKTESNMVMVTYFPAQIFIAMSIHEPSIKLRSSFTRNKLTFGS